MVEVMVSEVPTVLRAVLFFRSAVMGVASPTQTGAVTALLPSACVTFR